MDDLIIEMVSESVVVVLDITTQQFSLFFILLLLSSSSLSPLHLILRLRARTGVKISYGKAVATTQHCSRRPFVAKET